MDGKNCRRSAHADPVRVANSPEDWFSNLGYEVTYEDADGWTWASLRPKSNPGFVVQRYGRGLSQEEAVSDAKRRYELKQDRGASGDAATD